MAKNTPKNDDEEIKLSNQIDVLKISSNEEKKAGERKVGKESESKEANIHSTTSKDQIMDDKIKRVINMVKSASFSNSVGVIEEARKELLGLTVELAEEGINKRKVEVDELMKKLDEREEQIKNNVEQISTEESRMTEGKFTELEKDNLNEIQDKQNK